MYEIQRVLWWNATYSDCKSLVFKDGSKVCKMNQKQLKLMLINKNVTKHSKAAAVFEELFESLDHKSELIYDENTN